MQIELDAGVVFEHLETDRVLPADEFLLGIDTNVQVVREQIIVGAVRPVGAAEEIGVGGRCCRLLRCRGRGRRHRER